MKTEKYYQKVMTGISHHLYQELKIIPNRHYALGEAVNNPRTISLSVFINPHYLRPIVALREQLAMAAGLDKGQTLRVVRGQRGTLTLEIPKPKPLWFNISVKDLPPGEGVKTTVGINQQRQLSVINFAHALTPHLLIAGTTGSGKTNAQQLIAHNLAAYNSPQDVKMILFDIEKRGLRWKSFNHLAHLAHPVITEQEEARQALAWTLAEIDQRRQEHRTSPRLFLCIDELQALVQQEGVIEPIVRIAQMGREYNVHFIGAVQNPTKANIGHSDIQRNIQARLVGRVSGGLAAYLATGQKETGADQLAGAGDFLLVQPGQLQRLTVALLTEKDIAQLPRHATAPPHLPLADYSDVSRLVNMVTPNPAGRPVDDYDWLKVGYVLARLAQEESLNPNTLKRSIKTGIPKAQRFITAAEGILTGLRATGYEVVPSTLYNQ